MITYAELRTWWALTDGLFYRPPDPSKDEKLYFNKVHKRPGMEQRPGSYPVQPTASGSHTEQRLCVPFPSVTTPPCVGTICYRNTDFYYGP